MSRPSPQQVENIIMSYLTRRMDEEVVLEHVWQRVRKKLPNKAHNKKIMFQNALGKLEDDGIVRCYFGTGLTPFPRFEPRGSTHLTFLIAAI